MIPQQVDIPDLSAQLRADGVAFSNGELANNVGLQSSIQRELAPGEGIAVVDVIPHKVADLRDIAQELADSTGLDTVIVQAPTAVSIVSSQYPRATLEAVQAEVPNGSSQIALLQQTHSQLDGFNPPMVPVIAISVLAFLVVFYLGFRFAIKPSQ